LSAFELTVTETILSGHYESVGIEIF
jgi:hypothetical protein